MSTSRSPIFASVATVTWLSLMKQRLLPAAVLHLDAQVAERGEERRVGNFKTRLHRGLRLAGADEIVVGAAAQDEVQRVDDDRLARPRLTGEHVEALAELNPQAVNNGKMGDLEFFKHLNRGRSACP
jgi:hypothetical protein